MDQEVESLIDESVKEISRGYGDSQWKSVKGDRIPSELLLPGDIVSATHLRPDSPMKLELQNNSPIITENGKKVSDVSFLPRPKIWSHKTKSGVNMKRIANFYGRDCLNFNIYSGCEFWEIGLPCKFCSVKPTQLKYRGVEIKKQIEDIKETAELAFKLEDRIDFILVTGGSYIDGDKEIDMMINVLKEIQGVIPKLWNRIIKGNGSLMIPETLEKLDELMATGIEHPSFNLEVWGKRYFNYICPGKAQTRGWDGILKTYEYGVSKFGRGVFWVNFVSGLNNINTLKKGFTYMAEMGVVPGSNIFHPDVGSVLGEKRKSPSTEYIIELFRHAAKLYHKHNYLPFFNEKCLRNSIANEAYLGYV